MVRLRTPSCGKHAGAPLTAGSGGGRAAGPGVWTLAFALISITTPVRAAELPGTELAHQSPFLPAGQAATAAAGASTGQALEIRGIMSNSGDERYWIYDVRKKSGAWVGLQEKGYPFIILSADSARNEVRVRNEDGRVLTLALRDAKVNDVAEKSGAGLVQLDPSVEASTEGEAAKPEPDPRWKKLEEDAARRALERAQALRTAGSP